ncbi:MAG TPA: MASE1 domain-containing protein [Myxococcales bacterium]|nr:MASE1 domain-containing protein [Myxococcales bacterium]
MEVRPPRARLSYRTAVTALLVGAGYYAGANLGFILRFPPTTPSVVWPPNAILTATLLLAPRRRWRIYLIAAFAAHLAAEVPAGWPLPLVLFLFATNCSEALLAAFFVRAFSDAPARMDTLRRVVVFVAGAALLAPFLSSFLDAAAVTAYRGESYWSVWRTRLFSNVLTELTVAPAILNVVCAWKDSRVLASPRRRLEAAALSVLLVVTSVVVFSRIYPVPTKIAGSPLAWLLPLLLWASVRFEPVGTSLSLLAVTLVATWVATHAEEPFLLAARGYVVSLQIFLSVMAIPLMCLAGVIEDWRRVGNALQERLRFEGFLARFAAPFVHLPIHEIDHAIPASLRNIGEFLQLDRVLVLRMAPDRQQPIVAHHWAAPGIDPEPRVIVSRDWPPAVEQMLRYEPYFYRKPGDAGAGKLPDTDVRSSVTIPLLATGRVIGGLVLDSINSDRSWPDETLQGLQLVAEVFASALARKEAEVEMQRSRQELAHIARVSTMGELTASLAHELSQPLTGIMTNAQAARRLLQSGDTAELQAALEDIVADNRRASDVIHRLRDLLRKGELQKVRLDLNDVIHDVTRLLGSDAIIRSTAMKLELHPTPLVVSGDRVQLQQVILNLLLNAMDAMTEVAEAERVVVVRSGQTSLDLVHVQVEDAGSGIPDKERIFEPFYTTKPAGMGMGLSIAKSIVEVHGGVIWAANNTTRGATFHFMLPKAAA